MSTEIEYVLCHQDLSDFLDGNEEWMDKYSDAVYKRIKKVYPDAMVTVRISKNTLADQICIDGEWNPMAGDGYEIREEVEDILIQIANELDDVLG